MRAASVLRWWLTVALLTAFSGCAGPEPAPQGSIGPPVERTFDFTPDEPRADRLRPGSLLEAAARAAVPHAPGYSVRLASLLFSAGDGTLLEFTVTYEAHWSDGNLTLIDYRPHPEGTLGTYRAWVNASRPEDYAGPKLELSRDAAARLERHTFQELFDAAGFSAETDAQFSLFPGAVVEPSPEDGHALLVSNEGGLRREAGTYSVSQTGTDGPVVALLGAAGAGSLVRFE